MRARLAQMLEYLATVIRDDLPKHLVSWLLLQVNLEVDDTVGEQFAV